ncbi:hypothetical protein [Companilactobacillus sp. DQM5]|uniref:hypothetical protein n=1 Tax=Companilactobacillus sp. DQM5 TaxID=3463359 RepID=UPI004059D3FF
MDQKEKKRRNKVFLWAIIVVAVNIIQYIYHNSITIGIALVITVYALYVITIKDRVEKDKKEKSKKSN